MSSGPWLSFNGGWLIYSDPPPITLHGSGDLGPMFLKSFFDIVLGSPCCKCWCQLIPKLPPNLGQKSTQHRSKSLDQNPSQLVSCVRSPFGSIFGWGFRPPKPSKINKKREYTNQPKQHNSQKVKHQKHVFVYYVFYYFGHVVLCWKVNENCPNID